METVSYAEVLSVVELLLHLSREPIPPKMELPHLDRESRPQEMKSPLILNEGMELSAEEFQARYLKSVHNLRKVQLINGIVRMPSPVWFEAHDEPNVAMIGLVYIYSARMAGVRPINSATLKLISRNTIHPCFGLRREDGSSRVEKDYVEGAVELFGEISASNIRRDTT